MLHSRIGSCGIEAEPEDRALEVWTVTDVL